MREQLDPYCAWEVPLRESTEQESSTLLLYPHHYTYSQNSTWRVPFMVGFLFSASLKLRTVSQFGSITIYKARRSQPTSPWSGKNILIQLRAETL